MSDLSIDKRFPKPTLSKIEGPPNHASLAILGKEINSNALSIPSNRGLGTYGHLVLTVTPEKYLDITGVAFVAPVNPGEFAIHGNHATIPQINETNRTFNAAQRESNQFKATEAMLKQQLLRAVDSIYLEELNDDVVGFAAVTCLELLQYLHSQYGGRLIETRSIKIPCLLPYII
jgi:hypothetical protein